MRARREALGSTHQSTQRLTRFVSKPLHYRYSLLLLAAKFYTQRVYTRKYDWWSVENKARDSEMQARLVSSCIWAVLHANATLITAAVNKTESRCDKWPEREKRCGDRGAQMR